MIPKQYFIEKYLGIPYIHRGRNLSGLDCYGLIIAVYKDLGFDLFDMDNYDINWSFQGQNYLLENYHKEWEQLDKPKMLYDGIMFHSKKGVVNHGGVVIDDTHFMHCCKAGVCVARMGDTGWKERFEGYYHLKARDF